MFEPDLKTLDPLTVAYIRMHGPYGQMTDGYGELYGWIAQHGFQPAGMPSAIYLTLPDEVPEAKAEWELWAPLAGSPPEQPTSPDDFCCGIKHIEPRLVAYAIHEGPFETISETTYAPLTRWIAGQGYEIVGPPEEVYLTDADEVRPEEYLTEIRFPVAKR